MNIIFVDIDGPLLPRKMYLFHNNHKPHKVQTSQPDLHMPLFDPYAIRCFNLWAKYGQAQVVFSTNWGYSYSVEDLKAMMHHNGLEVEYHEQVVTPKRFSSSRHTEILDWLRHYSQHGDRFLVVDDDTSCQYIQPILDDEPNIKAIGGWVEIDFNDGINYDNFKKGCQFLGFDIDDVYEQEFNIKKLTKEEKEQRQKDLELLSRCII